MADEIQKEEYEEYIQETQPSFLKEENKIEVFKDKNNDTDGDGLKDFEEEYFGTDINSVDTDNDGYSDYEEIQNKYNPLGEGQLQDNTLTEIFHKLSNTELPLAD